MTYVGTSGLRVNIPPTHCPICGKGRNQHTNHRACSLKLQQQKAAYNKTRGAGI
jgi:predicted nucleic acid-binding Zn ribbon protein